MYLYHLNQVLSQLTRLDIHLRNPLSPNHINRLEGFPYYPRNPLNQILQIFQIYFSFTRIVISFLLKILMIEYVASYKNMQETVRRQEGEIYALQSKVIQLERQLDAYRRPEVPIGAIDLQRRPYRRWLYWWANDIWTSICTRADTRECCSACQSDSLDSSYCKTSASDCAIMEKPTYVYLFVV